MTISNNCYKDETFTEKTFGDNLKFINCTFTPICKFGQNVTFVDCTFKQGESCRDVNVMNGYTIVSGGTVNSSLFLGKAIVGKETIIGVHVVFDQPLNRRSVFLDNRVVISDDRNIKLHQDDFYWKKRGM